MQLLHLSERIRGPETSRESGKRVERDGNSAWFVRLENADVLGPEDRLESRFGTDLERVGVPVDVGNISLKTAAEIEFDVPAQSFTSRFGGGVQDVWNKSLGDKYTVAIVYDLDEAWAPIPQILKRNFIIESALSDLTVSRSTGAYSLGSLGKSWKAREVSTLTGLAFNMSRPARVDVFLAVERKCSFSRKISGAICYRFSPQGSRRRVLS